MSKQKLFKRILTKLDKSALELKSDGTGEFEGYCSVFDSVDAVGDTIAPGAFTKSLSDGNIPKMFINHRSHEVPVGDWTSMIEDDHGLKGFGLIDMNHKDGPSLHSAMKRGAMDGLSIGFSMEPGDFEKSEAGRLIKNVRLMEVSVVAFPCEGQARIQAVKSEIADFGSLKDFEDYLREACDFSKAMATMFVGQIAKVVRSDSEKLEHELTNKANAEVLAVLETLKSKL